MIRRDSGWLAELHSALQGLPGVEALDEQREGRGLWLTLRAGGRSRLYRLQPVSAGEGFPQDVRRALGTAWDDERSRSGETPVRVLYAPQFSPGARRLLDEAGASYVERGGAVRVLAPGLLVSHEASSSAPAAAPRSRWSPGFAAVAESLLTDLTEDVPLIAAIAERVSVSPATAGKALQFFDSEGWTRSDGAARGVTARRVMVDPAGLLGSWARWTQEQDRHTVLTGHAVWQNSRAFITDSISSVLPTGSWCVGGWAAADIVAPFASTVPTISLYVDPVVWPAVQAELRTAVRPVEAGPRVFVHLLSAALIRLGTEGELPLASTPRIYADLLGEGSRGEAAADHLRQVVLGV